jgi:hypothetical protein
MHNRRSGTFRRRSNHRSFRRHNNDNEGRRLTSGAFTNTRGKNNFKPYQSAEKLLERYKLLAKEAFSSGDKTLLENYLQHADHFERVVSNKNSNQNGSNLQTDNTNKEQNKNSSTDSTSNQGNITNNEE